MKGEVLSYPQLLFFRLESWYSNTAFSEIRVRSHRKRRTLRQSRKAASVSAFSFVIGGRGGTSVLPQLPLARRYGDETLVNKHHYGVYAWGFLRGLKP